MQKITSSFPIFLSTCNQSFAYQFYYCCNFTEDEEIHKHEHTEEKFGGDIVNAAIAGAITGLTSAAGTGSNTILTSYTTSVGNSMSNALLSGGSLKDAFKTGVKSLTDKDIIKNSITSGIVSSITVGLTDKLNSSITTNNKFTTALKEATTSSLVNTTIENTMNGGSFKDMLKDQLTTSLVTAGANLAAKGIGSNYHEGNIPKGTQLLLHGVVGAASSKLLGKDALSGATSSIIGEITGDILRNNGIDKETGKEIAGLTGGLSAILTGALTGLDEEEISSNIYNGQRLGKNAAENNAFYQGTRDLDGDKIWKSIGNHSFTISTPDNPEDFTPEKLIEQGLNPDDFKFIDLGDGKKSIVSSAFNVNGNLEAQINNKTDVKAIRDYYINGKSTAYGSNSWIWDFDVELK